MKVFEGTLLEQVAKSYQAAQEKSVDEYGALSKCSAALSMVVSLEKEAENGAANGMWTKSILFTIAFFSSRFDVYVSPLLNLYLLVTILK